MSSMVECHAGREPGILTGMGFIPAGMEAIPLGEGYIFIEQLIIQWLLPVDLTIKRTFLATDWTIHLFGSSDWMA